MKKIVSTLMVAGFILAAAPASAQTSSTVTSTPLLQQEIKKINLETKEKMEEVKSKKTEALNKFKVEAKEIKEEAKVEKEKIKEKIKTKNEIARANALAIKALEITRKEAKAAALKEYLTSIKQLTSSYVVAFKAAGKDKVARQAAKTVFSDGKKAANTKYYAAKKAADAAFLAGKNALKNPAPVVVVPPVATSTVTSTIITVPVTTSTATSTSAI